MPLPHPVQLVPSGDRFTHTEHGIISAHTELFRSDARMDEVLDIVIASRRESDTQLSIASVGCSNGAEAISILYYLEHVAPHIGRVSLMGMDINPAMIRLAQQGQFDLNLGRFRMDSDKRAEQLTAYGLEISERPDQSGIFTLDARPLYSRHNVSFVVADATKPSGAAALPESDVIFCNNLLYYFTDSPEAGEALVKNMVGRLSPEGIISLGSIGARLRPQQNLDVKMAAENMVPILFVGKIPFAFQREST